MPFPRSVTTAALLFACHSPTAAQQATGSSDRTALGHLKHKHASSNYSWLLTPLLKRIGSTGCPRGPAELTRPLPARPRGAPLLTLRATGRGRRQRLPAGGPRRGPRGGRGRPARARCGGRKRAGSAASRPWRSYHGTDGRHRQRGGRGAGGRRRGRGRSHVERGTWRPPS